MHTWGSLASVPVIWFVAEGVQGTIVEIFNISKQRSRETIIFEFPLIIIKYIL